MMRDFLKHPDLAKAPSMMLALVKYWIILIVSCLVFLNKAEKSGSDRFLGEGEWVTIPIRSYVWTNLLRRLSISRYACPGLIKLA